MNRIWQTCKKRHPKQTLQEFWRSLARGDNSVKSTGLPISFRRNPALFCKDYFGMWQTPRAVHCLHTRGWLRLETGPRPQQNCADCHKKNARPVRSDPQESQAAPWRLQGAANRLGGIPAAKRSPPNSSAYHVQESAENEQRAEPRQEHSRLLNSSLPRTPNQDSSAKWCNSFPAPKGSSSCG